MKKIEMLKNHYSGLLEGQVIESPFVDRLQKLVDSGFAAWVGEAQTKEAKEALETKEEKVSLKTKKK